MVGFKKKFKAFKAARPHLGEQVYWVVGITVLSVVTHVFITKETSLMAPTVVYAGAFVMTNLSIRHDMLDFYRNVGIASVAIASVLLVCTISLYHVNHELMFAKPLGSAIGSIVGAVMLYCLESYVRKRRNRRHEENHRENQEDNR